MTSERPEPSESGVLWDRFEDFLTEMRSALESWENLRDAEAILRTCLLTLSETQNQAFELSASRILRTVLQCVGPGRRIQMDSEEFAETLAQGIGTGISAEDGPCQEFRVGGTWYRFVPCEYVNGKGRGLEGSVDRESAAWSFAAENADLPRFRGSGESRETASANWRHLMHRRFQQLVRKRPFRMTEEEKADWEILSQLIDVEHYRKTTPIKRQETGFISALRSGVCEITWLGSEAVEELSLENAAPEFAGFGEGQWFEALVERNRGDYSLSKVIHAQPIDPIEGMTDEEWREWLSSLPTTETLPKSDTDWSTF